MAGEGFVMRFEGESDADEARWDVLAALRTRVRANVSKIGGVYRRVWKEIDELYFDNEGVGTEAWSEGGHGEIGVWTQDFAGTAAMTARVTLHWLDLARGQEAPALEAIFAKHGLRADPRDLQPAHDRTTTRFVIELRGDLYVLDTYDEAPQEAVENAWLKARMEANNIAGGDLTDQERAQLLSTVSSKKCPCALCAHARRQ